MSTKLHRRDIIPILLADDFIEITEQAFLS